MREELVSIASHELKTPLSSLQLQLQLMHRTLNESPLGFSVSHIKVLSENSLRQVKRLNVLIGELMDLTRISVGKLSLNPEPCDLADLVSQNVSALIGNATKKGSTITFSSNESVMGSFDSSRLGQVVTNLVDNAIKYGDGNPINVKVQAKGNCAVIEVIDQGKGILPEKQKRIFEPFERLCTDPYTTGLGLGLYICKEIVTAHRGNISVRSHLGEGSSFIVELPMKGTH